MEVMASFIKFVALVDETLNNLKAENPETQSKEWCVINHLSKLSSNCHTSNSAKEVKNSVKALTRFAVDSLEWSSELSNKICHISKYHADLMKAGE